MTFNFKLFTGPWGDMAQWAVASALALVLVGALNVAAIETVWAGQVTPPGGRRTRHWAYPDSEAIALDKGAEMGRFNMGSTVLVLLGNKTLEWEKELHLGAPVRIGEPLARILLKQPG